MPIYGYQCSQCGYQKDVLQKLADAPLTECPSCGAATFSRQVSAPAFQLKGTGWYVTDFRDGGKPAAGKTDEAAGTGKDDGAAAKDPGKDAGKSAAPAPAPAAAAGTPAPAPTPTPASAPAPAAKN